MAGVGMQGGIKLRWFARVVEDFFGEPPYQVGSSLKASLGGGGPFRDVDVRLILPVDDDLYVLADSIEQGEKDG